MQEKNKKEKKRKNIRLWDLSNNFIIDKNLNAAARGTTITTTTKLADLEPYTRASEELTLSFYTF